jgi:hypothetical protein
MTPSRTLEDRLESTGAVLRDRPTVVDRVMAGIRQDMNEQALPPRPNNERDLGNSLSQRHAREDR